MFEKGKVRISVFVEKNTQFTVSFLAQKHRGSLSLLFSSSHRTTISCSNSPNNEIPKSTQICHDTRTDSPHVGATCLRSSVITESNIHRLQDHCWKTLRKPASTIFAQSIAQQQLVVRKVSTAKFQKVREPAQGLLCIDRPDTHVARQPARVEI